MNIISYRRYFNDHQYLREFEDFLDSVTYTERNPLNTELFFLWSMIRSTKPKLFIESGTFRGYSANFICEALARNANNVEFVSFGFNLDNCISYASQRLAKYEFARVVEGDARELITGFASESRPTAFFIDGPKGRNIPPLLFNILKLFANIIFIAVHDCEEESGSGNRWYVSNFFGNQYDYILCDSSFQERLSFLDQDLINRPEMHYWKPYFISGKPQDSYGTQTCFVIPKEKISRLNRIYVDINRRIRFYAYPYLKNQVKRLIGYENN